MFLSQKILMSHRCQRLFMMKSGEELKKMKNRNLELIWMEERAGLTQENLEAQDDRKFHHRSQWTEWKRQDIEVVHLRITSAIAVKIGKN